MDVPVKGAAVQGWVTYLSPDGDLQFGNLFRSRKRRVDKKYSTVSKLVNRRDNVEQEHEMPFHN